MVPRAGELFIILLAVVTTVVFYRLPALGDALGRLVGGRSKRKDKPSSGG